MYVICCISDKLSLGRTYRCSTWDEATGWVKRIVLEKGVQLTPKDVNAINKSGEYIDDNYQWSVCIGVIEEPQYTTR